MNTDAFSKKKLIAVLRIEFITQTNLMILLQFVQRAGQITAQPDVG